MIPKWLLNTDEGTWQGHLILGLIFFWPGYWLGKLTASGLAIDDPLLALTVAGTMGTITGFWGVTLSFAYREGGNYWKAIRQLGARLAFRRKALDGIGDFIFPLFGVFACINLVAPYGGFWHFIASIVAAEIVWLMIVAKKRNGDVMSVFRERDPRPFE